VNYPTGVVTAILGRGYVVGMPPADSYLATEWFDCDTCGAFSAHEWHVFGAKHLSPRCPVVALSLCLSCRESVVWINGARVWPGNSVGDVTPSRPTVRLGSVVRKLTASMRLYLQL